MSEKEALNNIEEEVESFVEMKDSEQAGFLLSVTPLVNRIAGRRLNFVQHAIEDITQKVLLNLVKWHSRNGERKLTSDEWEKVATRAAQNELKQYYKKNSRQMVLLSELAENNIELPDRSSNSLVEGNTFAEVRSLGIVTWKAIQELSLRQRYALLLQKQELITYLITSQSCKLTEIADNLHLSSEKLLEVIRALPFLDEEICNFIEKQTGEKLSPKQVWEARSKARTKLAKILKRI